MAIVHRDIKPSNIVVSGDGKEAKLIDFGQVLLSIHCSSHSPHSEQSRIVHAGGEMLTKVGTPFYEAPEVSVEIYTEKVTLCLLVFLSFVPNMTGGQLFVRPYVVRALDQGLGSRCPGSAILLRSQIKDRGPFSILHRSSHCKIIHCPSPLLSLTRNCCQENYTARPDFESITHQLIDFERANNVASIKQSVVDNNSNNDGRF